MSQLDRNVILCLLRLLLEEGLIASERYERAVALVEEEEDGSV